MKKRAYHNFFANFANKTRLNIILCLMLHSMSVNEIAEKINEEQSKISHNLKSLIDCHILDVKKEGKRRMYSVNKKTVIPLLDVAQMHVNNNCRIKCGKEFQSCMLRLNNNIVFDNSENSQMNLNKKNAIPIP